ncbi:MAG TPA: EamA family transporter [Gemmatimonadaceae bacterium]|nr:EamA family transporter [Gemmatimonadaceae bacterium]
MTTPTIDSRPRPSRTRIALAFAAVYLVWGSTYLAILYAIETIPPFLMAGTRFLVAGGILYLWARLTGAMRPSKAQWMATAITGILMLAVGNGAVTWSEQRIPSGLAALFVATVALWMVLLEFLRKNGTRPTRLSILGLLLGFGGVAVLVGPAALTNARDLDVLAALVLIGASLSWAAGSVYSRVLARPSSAAVGSGMQMLAGGVVLTIVGLSSGELGQFDVADVTTRSALSIAYLIVFGSLVGFTAYSWLLRVCTPAAVATYAYVNPMVAMFLGWLIAGEEFSPRMIIAAAIILSGVALINRASARPAAKSGEADATPERASRLAPPPSAAPKAHPRKITRPA